jgi:DNA-binding beta-propeller fold protein YncE
MAFTLALFRIDACWPGKSSASSRERQRLDGGERPAAAHRPRELRSLLASVLILSFSSPLMMSRADAESAPLVLEKTILLPDVGGRIDHMTIDRKRQRLIVAALGNDTVEIIDLAAGKPLQSIRGLAEPQGVAFVDRTDVVFTANARDGSVRAFSGTDFSALYRIDLRRDADNIHIDPRNGSVVVGYGSGSLAIIDPAKQTVIGTVILQGHPEGFQIDPATGRAFVNVPDAGQIAVVDLDARRQTGTWKIPEASGNFPMALDSPRGVLAAVFRSPSLLVLLNTKTGTVIARLSACGDADDVFFDPKRERIYVSCGSGEIAVFQLDGGNYRRLPRVATESGARTSLYVPELDRLLLAVRAGLLGSGASIQIFRPTP